MELNKSKAQRHYEWVKLIVAGLAGYLIISAMLFVLHTYQDWPVSKDKIRDMTAQAAENYCLTHQQPSETMDCNNLKIEKIVGPVEYGPTDGGDEYYGNWFITFRSDKDLKSQIFVASDLKGKIQYINVTGHRQYPDCDLGKYNRCSSFSPTRR